MSADPPCPRKTWEGANASFAVLPRKRIFHWCRYKAPREWFAVISIFDSDKDAPAVAANRWMRGLLRLQYDDVEPIDGATYKDRLLFSPEQAKQVWEFVQRMKGIGVKTYAVHCEQGICRSAATAAAISQALNGDSQHFFDNYAPNQFVYDTLMENKPDDV